MGSYSVCEVTQNPGQFRDAKTISIEGVVTDAWDLFLVKYFILKDEKGECAVAVQSEKINPDVGQTVVITGVISSTINYEDQTFVLIRESSE